MANSLEDIEVTKEMLEAGTDELTSYDPEFDDGFEFVTRLYRIMEWERRFGATPWLTSKAAP